jgi:hypothetical protein
VVGHSGQDRQGSLRAVGIGEHLLRLVRDPADEHDPHAVAIMCGRHLLGHLPARLSAPYSRALRIFEAATPRPLLVPGSVVAGPLGLAVLVDCPSAGWIEREAARRTPAA